MRKFFLSLTILYLFPQIIFCQSAGIKGKLADSSSTETPVNAVIAVLNQQDSTLVTFSRSDKNGNFQTDIEKKNNTKGTQTCHNIQHHTVINICFLFSP